MADNSRRFPGTYEQGQLVSTDPMLIEREAWSRDRTGVSQVERVMRGKRGRATVARDGAALRAQGIEPVTGPGGTLKVAPGSVVGQPTIDMRARDKITGRAQYSSDLYLPGFLYTQVRRSPSLPPT